jgi:hypothetical protein
MMIRTILLIASMLGGSLEAFSQVESVRVEQYYITDEVDATDESGGDIEAGCTTYRIFVDLAPGTLLTGIYGDDRHPLVFSSTSPFFNHSEDGISYGKDFSRSRYANGTVPLDTYITLGQVSRSFAQGAYFAVPKDMDQDGSIVGGVNNDGGSDGIPGGLLVNDAAEIGIPLTVADGMMIEKTLPTSWIDIGFMDLLTSEDTTIFGSVNAKQDFVGSNVLLRNSGVTGVDPQVNEILVAQLTTKGEIAFELNLEVVVLIEGVPTTLKYVASNEALGQNEIFSPLLKYPYACGCTDPQYLEASTSFACTDNSKCVTPVVLGCGDSLACNYDPNVNYHLEDLCCYVGFCNDLDISVVCPDLRPREDLSARDITLYPNPATTDLFVGADFVRYADLSYTIADIFGRHWLTGKVNGIDKYIDISILPAGYYSIQIKSGQHLVALPFVRL